MLMNSQADSPSRTGGQRYRYLFEHAPICIIIIDLNANPATILEVNLRAQLVYGYPATEMIGMPVAQLAPAELTPEIRAIVRQVQRGQRVTTETTNQHRDGARFPVRVIAAPDPGHDGKMIIMVEDITAQQQRRTEAAAIDADRRRIAHEIHDGVAQNLAGLRFKSAFWSHVGEAAPPDMRAALDEIQRVITDAIFDLRRAIFALRPLDLDALGFSRAVTQLVADFGEQNQLAAQVEISGTSGTLPAAYELPLFRIIQEGLNNVGLHARATSASVHMAVDAAGEVMLSIRDNGCGFDPRQLSPNNSESHFGLRQMRERVVDQGGTMDIRSAIGQGTALVFTLPPISEEANHAAD